MAPCLACKIACSAHTLRRLPADARRLLSSAPPQLKLPHGPPNRTDYLPPPSAAVGIPALTLLDPAAAAPGVGLLALSTLLKPGGALVDPNVLGATLGSSFKLGLVCALVGWLLRDGHIPSNTSAVLSKVSFTLLIPCMLFSKVSSTLAAQPDPAILATISAATVLQVLAGAVLGQLVAAVVDGWGAVRRRQLQTVAVAGGPAGGLQQLQDRPAAEGLSRLVTLACSFGSSFTLPILFFSTMLPAAAAERALSCTALILLSWSPLLWSFGLSVVDPEQTQTHEEQPQLAAASRVAAKPRQAQPTAAAAPAAAWQGAWQRCCTFGRRTLTPPFLAILAGMLVGLTPLGRSLFTTSTAGAAAEAAAGSSGVQVLPLGLQLARAVLKSAMEVVVMLASGTLAAQTVVLAASLLQQSQQGSEPHSSSSTAGSSSSSSSSSGSTAGGSGGGGGWGAGLRRLLLPESAAESRALTIVCLTRFLLLPTLTLVAVWGLKRAGLLPNAVASDPILLLVLLAQSVMPSAQNLIIMLQLSPNTQAMAPMLARMLLKLYCYAALPVSLWVTAWATWLGVQVVC